MKEYDLGSRKVSEEQLFDILVETEDNYKNDMEYFSGLDLLRFMYHDGHIDFVDYKRLKEKLSTNK